jgi:hypothetical protein
VQEGPFAALVHDKKTDRWRIELRDLKGFRDALGADVINGFCRCFVHADRLTSLISLAYASMKQHGQTSLAFARNLQTMVWFTVGTLRELALAIRDTRSALARQGLLNPQSEPWRRLREVESRWDGDPFFRDMRNVASFHVDRRVIETGLARMEAEGIAILSEGQGPIMDDSTLRLGLESLLNGTGRSLEGFDRFFATVSADHAIATTIQEAFILALDAKGIGYGEA